MSYKKYPFSFLIVFSGWYEKEKNNLIFHSNAKPVMKCYWIKIKITMRSNQNKEKSFETLFNKREKASCQLTSESAPLSAPGHLNVTYSWHLLWTTNEQTVEGSMRVREERKRDGNWISDGILFSHGIIIETKLKSARGRRCGVYTLALESLFAEAPKLVTKEDKN